MINIPDLLKRFTDGHKYRQVTREDLVPGAMLIHMEIRTSVPIHENSNNLGCLPYTQTEIRIDDKAFNDENTHVLFHCVSPGWDGQCFVPIDEFVDPNFCPTNAAPGNWLDFYLVSTEATVTV